MDPQNQDLSRRTSHRRRLGALALLIVVAVIVTSSAGLHDRSEEAVTALGALIARHPGLGVVAFIGLAAVSAMMAFVTSVVLVPVAVHHWGPVITALLLWVGWLLGGAGAYAIGRYFGGPAVRRVVGTDRAKHFEDQITARAPFLVVVLFQIALQSEIPAYLMGMARYPLSRYLLALGVAELPFAVGAVLLGSGFLNREYGLMVGVGLAGIAVVSLAVGALHRQLAKGRESHSLFLSPGGPRSDQETTAVRIQGRKGTDESVALQPAFEHRVDGLAGDRVIVGVEPAGHFLLPAPDEGDS
jgi:uncharacterized membrane protein YdjX (TVP38/TMEM64 family)